MKGTKYVMRDHKLVPKEQVVTDWYFNKETVAVSSKSDAVFILESPIKLCRSISSIDMTPSWVDTWLQEKQDIDQEDIKWLRSLSNNIKELMIKFPPSYVVKSNIPLHTADNGYGIVSSYSEDGMLTIRANPDADIRGFVDPKHLTVVGYWNNMTPERIKTIFGHKE